MNPICAISAAAMLGLLAGSGSLAHAEDWTTTDGKVYKQVQVLRVEADTVTFIYGGGGTQVPLAKLPPDVQERLKEWGKTPSKKIIMEPRQPRTNAP